MKVIYSTCYWLKEKEWDRRTFQNSTIKLPFLLLLLLFLIVIVVVVIIVIVVIVVVIVFATRFAKIITLET